MEKALRRLSHNPRTEAEDQKGRQTKRDREALRLGITIDRAVSVTSKDVALIADVAREDSHTMVTLTRKASFDIEQANREWAAQRARNKDGKPTSPDEAVSRDVTLAIPWNVFTTGTLSVVEKGTVLRARVLETVVISEDPAPKKEIKKPVPKPPRRKRPRRKPRPRPKCPCCYACFCNKGMSCSCHDSSSPKAPGTTIVLNDVLVKP